MFSDEVDKKIVSILRADGRSSYKKISEALDFSVMGAKKRTDKLLEEDLIDVKTDLNVEALGYYAAIILLEVDNRNLKNILNKFKKCPRVVNCYTLLSGYNLAALIISENRDTFESEFGENCSLRNQEGIRRSEFYPIGAIHYTPFLPIRMELFTGLNEATPCGVMCGECARYIENKCLACPATKSYRGF